MASHMMSKLCHLIQCDGLTDAFFCINRRQLKYGPSVTLRYGTGFRCVLQILSTSGDLILLYKILFL